MRYHHTGVITTEKQPNELYVEATKVSVTNPDAHPYRIEFLRYEPDSPVRSPVRDQCHMAFEVDDLDTALAGKDVVLGPFDAVAGIRVAFFVENGAVFEYLHFSKGRTEIS